MNANLHLHSRFSDGVDWPWELARRAAAASLELVALTDHDSLAGCQSFAEAARAHGLHAVTACEIDVTSTAIGYRSELLAYFPGGPPVVMARFLEERVARRRERLAGFIETCKQLFNRPNLSLEELLHLKMVSGWVGKETTDAEADAQARPERISLNKVDLYHYLRRHGLIAATVSYPAFRRDNFASGRIPDRGFHHPGAEEAIAAARADGGLVVLPHPGHEFDDDPRTILAERPRLGRLLDWCREAGVVGVELYWYGPVATGPINTLVLREAEARGLFLTYGSDCHGPGSGKETLGAFSGDFRGFPGFPAP